MDEKIRHHRGGFEIMATQKICDRCGSNQNVDNNELIEFFAGNIEFYNIDLCEECFQVFAKFLDKFVNYTEEDLK